MTGSKSLMAVLSATLLLAAAALPVSAARKGPVVSAASSTLSKTAPQERTYTQVLSSRREHGGAFDWKMQQIGKVTDTPEAVSSPGYDDSAWMSAIVPGTVLHSLVENGVYPDPYHGDNNKLDNGLIPDLAKAGRDFYAYWFRTKVTFPAGDDPGLHTWFQFDGVNYHTEVWLNGHQRVHPPRRGEHPGHQGIAHRFPRHPDDPQLGSEERISQRRRRLDRPQRDHADVRRMGFHLL